MDWAYGVTTVPDRRKDLLPRTLESLRKAGFDQPRLFIDHCPNSTAVEYEQEFGLEVTARFPRIRTFGNWVLALGELYLRQPAAHRYALFQDDLVTYRHLRQYLDQSPTPERSYLNGYTSPANYQLARGPDGRAVRGWYPSNQFGRGALMLIFPHQAVVDLLTHHHMVVRPQDLHRGHRSIDGGIVSAMTKAGWTEVVHNPSLCQHTGLISSMGNNPQLLSINFHGEEFDALDLLQKPEGVQ